MLTWHEEYGQGYNGMYTIWDPPCGYEHDMDEVPMKEYYMHLYRKMKRTKDPNEKDQIISKIPHSILKRFGYYTKI